MAQRNVKDVGEEIADEKEDLKAAEEREKERKAQEEIEKEERKAAEKEAEKEERKSKEEKVVQVRKKPRHGKKYRSLAEQVEKGKEYPISEALELATKTSPTKFDATVEAHVKINSKEKNIRGTLILTGGVVKEKRILAANDKNVEEIIAKVKKGDIDFDVMIADLKVMPKLAQLAKTLGPKGLMPSPKAGTAVENVEEAIEELKRGRVEFRADKFNIVHMPIGKISFGIDRIRENYDALMSHLPKRLESIYVSTTMGPSIKVKGK
ncbi:MAG: 50S ribosomal protein L1 [Patescibacteria group bacterium]|jgi:large subunit ribosomal protein L1